ncbi:MAG: radical SAM family heme chaperone HemW [Nitrospiraceae bacterium]
MTDRPERGLYIHIPFCHQRCHFCAFYLEIHQPRLTERFLSALLSEMDHYQTSRPFAGHPLDSLYFGGGTPPTLSSEQLATLIRAVRARFGLQQGAEITVEAHPAGASAESLARLLAAGVNRVSFGAESMDPRELQRVGRPGSPLETAQAVGLARAAGFHNICLDLMYGLPGQTLHSWSRSLEAILHLAPTHVSCYALTIEEGTHLQASIRRGSVPAPDEGLQNDMEERAEQVLTEAGYVRYEISNYARPGYASRHNLLYWTNGRYLGLGPSAQSYVGSRRFGNVADLDQYMARLEAGALPVTEDETLSEQQVTAEQVMFGLRLCEGLPMGELEPALPARLRDQLDHLRREALLERHDSRLRLTPLGRTHFDTVAVSLLGSLDSSHQTGHFFPLTSGSVRAETE